MKIEPNRKSRFEATFSIKFAHARPKTPSPSKPSNDGDIHISGTAPEIGLLTVAEIMNAVDFPPNPGIYSNQTGRRPRPHDGVWRIWPEHGGESHHAQVEADPNDITDTNPDHNFEIHPKMIGD